MKVAWQQMILAMSDAKSDIIYRPLNMGDKDLLMRYLLDYYFKQSPHFSSLNFANDEISIDKYADSCLCHKMSYGAFDGATMVAFLTTIEHEKSTWISPTGEKIHKANSASSKINKIAYLKQHLHGDINLFDRYDTDYIAEISRIVVLYDYQRRGIASKINRLVEDAILAEGYKVIFTRTSSIYLCPVYEKMGYEKLAEIVFDELVGEDNLPLVPVQLPHKSYILWGKRI